MPANAPYAEIKDLEIDGYHFYLFGLTLLDGSSGDWPIFTIAPGTENSITIQLWFYRLTHPRTSGSVEVLWNPQRGRRVSVQGLADTKKRERELLMKGVDLIEGHKRRRPIGTTKYSLAEFQKRAVTEFRKWIKQRDDEPTGADLAANLGIATSTFHEYMHKCGLKMQQLRQLAKRPI